MLLVILYNKNRCSLKMMHMDTGWLPSDRWEVFANNLDDFHLDRNSLYSIFLWGNMFIITANVLYP